MIELRTFGSVGLLDSEGRDLGPVLAQPKRLALLAYLAAARPQGLHRRDQLLPLFWPDQDESHARDALSQALRFLRQTVGPESLVKRGADEIGVDPARIWCDAVAFRTALDQGRPAEALELYRGAFLPGFFAESADGFEAWLEGERAALRDLAACGARQLADQYEAGGARTLAISWGRRAMDLAPDDERALRRLLGLYTRSGDRAGAIRVYEDYARRLQTEYACQPAPETRELAELLRTGRPLPGNGSLSRGHPASAEASNDGDFTQRYRIERPLGAGGMATVFLTRDLKLERDVAVKILRPDITQSLARERFVREIRIAGKLQHPNIVPLFDSGEVDGQLFYTMPFVEGESLRARLARVGPLPIEESVGVLRDVATALVHAHDKGVIHRDIKPDNVLLIDGRALITDFGIARAAHAARTPAGSAEPSVTQSDTSLGTPGYMAPEQAAGNPEIDHRADLFALGVLGYEMLAGRPPFTGATPQDVVTAVLTEAPVALASRRPDVPTPLADLIIHCLEKQPGARPDSARDVMRELDAAATPNAYRAPPADARPRSRNNLALRYLIGGVTLAGAAAAVSFQAMRFRPYEVTSTRILVATNGTVGSPSISSDGRLFAHTIRALGAGIGNRMLVRQVDGAGEIELAPDITRHGRPQWSPDGTTIFFSSALHPDTQVAYVVPALGGQPRQVIGPTYQILDPIWHPDGRRILYFSKGRIWFQSLEGGDRVLVPVDSGCNYGCIRDFAISKAGTRLAYTRGAPDRRVGRQTIWTVPLGGADPVRLTDTSANSWSPRWAPDGRSILYLSDADGVSDLYQQRISRRGNPVGVAARITTGLGAGQISIDTSGRRLIFSRVRNFAPLAAAPIPASGEIPLTTFQSLTGHRESVQWPDVSADGQWLVFDSDRAGRGDGDIYKMRSSGGNAIRVTDHRDSDFMPKWSPDGREIAYYRVDPAGNRNIRVVSAAGQNDRAVTSGPGQRGAPAWAPTGDALVFGSDSTLAVVTRRADGSWSEPRMLPESTPAFLPRWSADGKLIVFASRGAIRLISPEGGLPRTLVEAGALGGPAWSPVWSPDSRTVFLVVGHPSGFGYSYWAVSLSGQAPRRLLNIEELRSAPFATDGRRIYMTQHQEQSDLGLLEFRP